jgi:hypothetical protein
VQRLVPAARTEQTIAPSCARGCVAPEWDVTIVNVALPHIQRSLGFSGSNLEC